MCISNVAVKTKEVLISKANHHTNEMYSGRLEAKHWTIPMSIVESL